MWYWCLCSNITDIAKQGWQNHDSERAINRMILRAYSPCPCWIVNRIGSWWNRVGTAILIVKAYNRGMSRSCLVFPGFKFDMFTRFNPGFTLFFVQPHSPLSAVTLPAFDAVTLPSFYITVVLYFAPFPLLRPFFQFSLTCDPFHSPSCIVDVFHVPSAMVSVWVCEKKERKRVKSACEGDTWIRRSCCCVVALPLLDVCLNFKVLYKKLYLYYYI